MAAKISAYQPALTNQNKFCHGYGIFQYDIQCFCNVDPDYFVRRDYEIFEQSRGKCLSELKAKKTKIGLDGRPGILRAQRKKAAFPKEDRLFRFSLYPEG